MPRKRNLDPSVPLELKLPASLRTWLDLFLWSDLEGRVPQGKYQEFFVERIKEYQGWRRLDLSVYGFPQGYFVAGPKEMLDKLEVSLKREKTDVS